MSDEQDVEMHDEAVEDVDSDSSSSSRVNPHLGKLRFRNYKPRDELLFACVLEPAPLPTMVNVINAKLTKIEEDRENDTDILSLAPQKANWDLKRDLEKKLGLLDRRTQRALVELATAKLK